MAPVLKTGEVKASVGSNPTLSVSSQQHEAWDHLINREGNLGQTPHRAKAPHHHPLATVLQTWVLSSVDYHPDTPQGW